MEARPISDVISIGAAARSLGINPHRCLGLVEGLGIEPRTIGRMRVISTRDLDRIRRRLKARPEMAVKS